MQKTSSLITFIYNVKLTTKVQTLLSRKIISKTFNNLNTVLTKKFKCTKTIPMLYTEQGNLSQSNTITKIKDQILKLTLLLNDIQKTKEVRIKESKIQSNGEYALKTFINGMTEKF